MTNSYKSLLKKLLRIHSVKNQAIQTFLVVKNENFVRTPSFDQTKLIESVEKIFDVASELSKTCFFQNLQDLIKLAPLLIMKKL